MVQVCSFQAPAQVGNSPETILQVNDEPLPSCPADNVLVKMLAAPINPLDILTLQDKYVVKPENRSSSGGSIPGYDGIGEVVERGKQVTGFEVGDKVILTRHGIGTWRTYLLVAPKDLLVVPKDTPADFGAVLRMGATPAHLLLETAGKTLQPGDWIIQNAATSVIAHFVVQFARLRGLHVISVIRERAGFEEVAALLLQRGADLVIKEDQLADDAIFKEKRIMLGLDAVFGRLGERMAERMSNGGRFCSYGFQSGLGPDAHIKITPSLIWLRKISFEGFRLSQVLGALSTAQQQELVTWFSNLAITGQLSMPVTDSVVWKGSALDAQATVQEAVRASASGSLGERKKIITFEG